MEEPEKVLKSAEGHIAHCERLIAEHTHRRDHGDGVPSKETLTRWIEEAEAQLKSWRSVAEKAKAAMVQAKPLVE